MRKFRFRLDSVVVYREYLKKKAQRQLFETRQKQQMLVEKKRGLEAEQADTRQRLQAMIGRGVAVPVFELYTRHLESLSEAIAGSDGLLKDQEREIKKQEQHLKERLAAVKILERLKDRQQRAHDEKINREEQKVMDETVVMRGGLTT